MFFLKPHISNKGGFSAPSVQVRIEGRFLNIAFKLCDYTSPYADSSFEKGWRNWGLWEKDVFEVFLGRAEGAPYLELQVSPLGQRFALVVSTPREEFDYPEEDIFEAVSNIVDDCWVAKIRVALDKIPGKGDVRANFHSILGKSREHFSWNPNPEQVPDFHRPELFVSLDRATEGALAKGDA